MKRIFPRKLFPRLKEELKFPEIVVITGMRQVGKTTLLHAVYDGERHQNKLFIDLEHPMERKLFEDENYDNVISGLLNRGLDVRKNAFLFLDEIQYLPGIGSFAKYLYDHYRTKIFLTGSSSFYLKNLFPQSMAGRKALYTLYPLDFSEFLIFKKTDKIFQETLADKVLKKSEDSYLRYSGLFEEYMKYGGFPAVVLQPDEERKKMTLNDIFTSYFEKDVRTLADFRNLNIFRDIILLLAARAGSKIDISKIASETSVSRDTVYSYLNFLENTFLISLVPPFTKNINGEVRGAKKLYFCDTGLLNFLVSQGEGQVFENAVYNQIKALGNINYYQMYSGQEIDFVVDGKTGIEVKLSATESHIYKLKNLAAQLELAQYYIISKKYSSNPCVVPAMEL